MIAKAPRETRTRLLYCVHAAVDHRRSSLLQGAACQQVLALEAAENHPPTATPVVASHTPGTLQQHEHDHLLLTNSLQAGSYTPVPLPSLPAGQRPTDACAPPPHHRAAARPWCQRPSCPGTPGTSGAGERGHRTAPPTPPPQAGGGCMRSTAVCHRSCACGSAGCARRGSPGTLCAHPAGAAECTACEQAAQGKRACAPRMRGG